VIRVGGQTAMPYLRDHIADPRNGLGIPLAFDQDPMTVVARGAAIFAAAQPLELAATTTAPLAVGEYTAQLEYPRVSPDADPVVVGQISGPAGTTLSELSVELVDDQSDPPWRSGLVRLTDRGHFSTSLWATRGRRHVYSLVLTGATGQNLPVTPDQLSYIVGGVETDPTLGSAISVGLDGNRIMTLIPQNSPLPARRVLNLRTTVTVQKGEGGGMIRIPVLEGQYARGDRNRRIGRLEVHADQVSRTIPAGSEVTLTIEVDNSRLIHASVEVPMLDVVFPHTINLNTEAALEHTELSQQAEAEHARLAGIKERQRSLNSPLAELHLGRIEDEQLTEDVDTLVHAARASGDDALAAHKRIIDLRLAIDAAEDELRWPELVEEADSIMSEADDLVAAHGNARDQEQHPMYRHSITEAIESRDPDLLRQRIDQLHQHVARILDRGPTLQIMVFHHLQASRADLANTAHVDRLLADGQRAVDNGEYERLRSINLQLRDQLRQAPTDNNVFSTVDLFR
jgi:molecular chaperone DnaK